MDAALRLIGERLRKVFGDPTRRAMGWNLIDAFTRLEEREEALRKDDVKTDCEEGSAPETGIARRVHNDD